MANLVSLIHFLQRLFTSPVRVYLLVMGLITGLGALAVALNPEDMASALIFLPLSAVAKDAGPVDYTPLVQHWALLVALVGFFMVAASRKKSWELPAMAISGIEKFFIALFGWVLYPGEFVTTPGLILDTVGAAYSVAYFSVLIAVWKLLPAKPLD